MIVSPNPAIEAAADAFVGHRRSDKEGSRAALPCVGLFVIAGGHGCAERAHSAIEVVHADLERDGPQDGRSDPGIGPRRRDEVRLIMSPRRASRCPEDEHRESERRAGDASTRLAGVLLAPGMAYMAYAGDVRVYRFRHGRLERRTRDHVKKNGVVSDGAFAAEAFSMLQRRANAAIDALRGGAALSVKVHVECPEPGDLFVMGSEGLWRAVLGRRIAGILQAHSDLRLAASLMVDCAHEQGEQGDLTCVLARVGDA